jgi:hypothetical protein
MMHLKALMPGVLLKGILPQGTVSIISVTHHDHVGVQQVKQEKQQSNIQALLWPEQMAFSEEDIEEMDDAPSVELEIAEERIVDQASAARTIAELEAEISLLHNLEKLAAQVRRSGTDRKWEELASLLQDQNEMFDAQGHRRKLVVFTEHRDTLNYLTERMRTLIGRDDAIVTIHGGIGREGRIKAQEAFTQDKHTLILVATDAAGEGINLQRVHLMVNYDLPWNPNRLEQRFGRIHRIGQTEVCHLWNLVAYEREPQRYEITHVPQQIRNRTTRASRIPILLRYERVVFEKERLLVPGKPQATLVCPGHPLLDSVIDLLLQQHRDQLTEGTILIDDTDEGQDARVLFYLKHTIQDARTEATGKRHIISRQLQFIEIIEQLAMAAVMRIEQRLGYEPRDVSAEKCGYDIESRVPETGQLRFIEVKGRVQGAETVTVTRNEILISLNRPDDFILALVEVDGVKTTTHYISQPFPDTPLNKSRGFFLQPSNLPLAPIEATSRGSVSRSVLRSKSVCFRVPPGTASMGRESLLQNVESRILITIQDHATAMADVRTDTQRLLDACPTLRTVLTGVVGCYCNHRDSMQKCVVLQPLHEYCPTGIMDRFGKLTVTDHVAYLQVFIGNQVVRRDQRVCLLTGKILTLPLHFQMLLGQSLLSLFSIGRSLLFVGESSLESFQFVLSTAVVSGVLNRVSLRVRQQAFEPDIYTQLFPRWDMLDFAFSLDSKLDIVAISTTKNTYPFDVFHWEGFDVLFFVANQAKATNPAAIGEDDVFAIRLQFPSRLLVSHTPVVVLELRIAFLSRFLVLAIVIEPGDGKPSPISTCLTSLGVEALGKRECFRKSRAVDLQVIFGHTTAIHPQAQALIANELYRTYSFLNSLKLFLVAIQFVLVDQHACLLRRLLFDILLNNFRADISCCAIECGTCPQRRHSHQMREFFSQMMRGSSLDQACNVSWQSIGIGPDEEMDMIWLNCQLNDLPFILIYHFLNNLLHAVVYRADQDFSASFRTPNHVVHEQMNRVLFMDILLCHVNSIRQSNSSCQQKWDPCAQTPNKERPFIPALKGRGFLARRCKGWSTEAQAYNGLVLSWPQISQLAQRAAPEEVYHIKSASCRQWLSPMSVLFL